MSKLMPKVARATARVELEDGRVLEVVFEPDAEDVIAQIDLEADMREKPWDGPFRAMEPTGRRTGRVVLSGPVATAGSTSLRS